MCDSELFNIQGHNYKEIRRKMPQDLQKIGYFLRVDFCPGCYGSHTFLEISMYVRIKEPASLNGCMTAMCVRQIGAAWGEYGTAQKTSH